jgi:ABC-type transport system involved in multi-copper enzyme maturation permease subunit
MDAASWQGAFSVRHMMLLGLPAIVSTAFFLFLARICFLPRAFALPRHRVLAVFRWLDAAFLRANRRMGNVVFGRKDRALPGDQPIAWREMTQKRMGRPNYLFRLLLITEVPTIVALLCVMLEFDADVLSIIAAIAGSIAVLAIAVHGSNAFVAERANQTLDVLLTTPLRAAEIVRQKAAVMQRFVWVVSAPVATAFAYRAALQAGGMFTFNREENSALLYAVCATLTLAVYLPLVAWLSIGIGLVIRTRFRAIVVTLIVLVVWCALPIYIALGFRGFNNDTPTKVILCASPLALPALNEENELTQLNRERPWVPVLANFAVYGALLSGIRRGCLHWADRLLRR